MSNDKPPNAPTTIETLEVLAQQYAGPRAELMALEIQRAYVTGFARGYDMGLAFLMPKPANEEQA